MRLKLVSITTLALAILFGAGCNRKPKTECLFGDKIPQTDFEAISNVAGDLIMLLEGQQYKEMYEAGTEELRTVHTRDQFKLPLDLFVRSFGPLSYSRIEELYYMNSKSREERVMIACNLGEPGVDDLYGMPANRELAVAVFVSRTDLEQVRVVITLEKEKDAWKLRSVSLHPITVKSRSSDYFIKMAQQFRSENHLRVASLYLRTAMILLEMGINVNEFSTKVISEQLSQIKVDYLPTGEQQLWTMPSGNTYKVINTDASYDKGKLFVQFVHVAESVSDKDKIEAQARELAGFINQNFPEYRLGFDGIRVSATSEKQEEVFTAIHHQFLFSEMPAPPGAPDLQAPTANPTLDAEGNPVSGTPTAGSTAAPSVPPAPAPTVPAGSTTAPPSTAPPGH